ncbi:hypothetical protein B0H14DRAFT_2936960 [Mycena olivaceomarginata]|nr:hypothetical protein B0H14DRAFT_2936960 [Mycena olivaceomarginata]
MVLVQGSAVGTWVVSAVGTTACVLVVLLSRVRFLPVVWVVVVLVVTGMLTSLEDMVVQRDKEVLLVGCVWRAETKAKRWGKT